MTRRLLVVGFMTIIFTLVGNVSTYAQAGKTTAASGGTTGAPGGDPEETSGFGKHSNWDQLAGHQHGSLAFTGKVTVAGGVLPWDPIPVVVVCDGKTRFNTETDSKGRFRIAAPTRKSEISPENPGVKQIGPGELIGCNVRAVLLGFTSTTLGIANRSIMDDSDIGTINLSVDEKSKGAAESATTASASKDARKCFEKARAEVNERHTENAQKELEKAVKIDPQFAEAWYQLGKFEEAQKPQEAWEAFSKAAAADPQFAPTYEHLALLAVQQKKWQDASDATAHALELNPEGTPQIWYLSAAANYNLGHKEIAEKAAKTSLAMDPSHTAPNTEQLLAVMLAGRGDYSDALEHLRNCLTYTLPGPSADLIKQQVSQLEKLVPQAAKQ